MEQYIEFISAHWILSSLWVFFLLALVTYMRMQGGKALGIHETTQLINREDALVLDVRSEKDFAKGHIVNAVNIPLAKLKDRQRELDKHKDAPIVVVCNLGNQAGDAVKILAEQGFSRVTRMRGGITEWRGQGLPLVSK